MYESLEFFLKNQYDGLYRNTNFFTNDPHDEEKNVENFINLISLCFVACEYLQNRFHNLHILPANALQVENFRLFKIRYIIISSNLAI